MGRKLKEIRKNIMLKLIRFFGCFPLSSQMSVIYSICPKHLYESNVLIFIGNHDLKEYFRLIWAPVKNTDFNVPPTAYHD